MEAGPGRLPSRGRSPGGRCRAALFLVEDSIDGVRAGKAAGAFVVLVPNASVPPAPGTEALADLVIDRLADLDPGQRAGAGLYPAAGPRVPQTRLATPTTPVPGSRYRRFRVRLTRVLAYVLVRSLLHVRVGGRDHLAHGPAIYVFNHLNWSDPLVLLAVLPGRPKVAMFGPKEEDMARRPEPAHAGPARHPVPAGEGRPARVHATGRGRDRGRRRRGHRRGGPHPRLRVGAVAAQRRRRLFRPPDRIPIVPIAINGTSWLRFRGRVTVRVGEAIPADDRPSREAIEALTPADLGRAPRDGPRCAGGSARPDRPGAG